MIPERKYLKEALYAWIAAVVADAGRTDPVIWDNGNGVRPVPPFVALRFIGGNRPGLPSYTKVFVEEGSEDPGVQYMIQFVKKAVTLYGFGEDSFDLLQTIYDSLYQETYRTMLAQKGLVIPKALDITEVGTTLDTTREQQAHFDFFVTYNRVIRDRPGYVEQVIIGPQGIPMDFGER